MTEAVTVSCPATDADNQSISYVKAVRRLTYIGNATSYSRFTEFDAMGRVTAHRQVTGSNPAYRFQYGYNPAGQLENETGCAT